MKIKHKLEFLAKNEANAYIHFTLSMLGAKIDRNRLERCGDGYSRLGHVSLEGGA